MRQRGRTWLFTPVVILALAGLALLGIGVSRSLARVSTAASPEPTLSPLVTHATVTPVPIEASSTTEGETRSSDAANDEEDAATTERVLFTQVRSVAAL